MSGDDGGILRTEEGEFEAPAGYVFTTGWYQLVADNETNTLHVMAQLRHESTGAHYIALYPVDGGDVQMRPNPGDLRNRVN